MPRLTWPGRPGRAFVVAALVVLILASLLGAATYMYTAYRRATEDLIVQRDQQLALLTAVRLRDEMSQLANELQALSRSQSLYLGLTERQRLFLRGAASRLNIYDGGVILLDSTGRVRATMPERWEIMSHDWSDQEFFKAMLVSEPPAAFFSEVLDIGPEDSPVIVLSVPVLSEDKEVVGVLSGLFRLGESRLSAFYASIVRLRLAGTGSTYIMDSTGRVLYDSRYEMVGQRVGAEILQEALAGGRVHRTTDARGSPVAAIYTPMPGASWILVTETNWTEAMAPVQRLTSGLLVLLAVGMVLPATAVVLLRRGQHSVSVHKDLAIMEARLQDAMLRRFLPRHVPLLAGWDVGLYHQDGPPAASAHDLYDFMLLPDGKLMISLVTVAERGLAAVQLMATTRALFRAAACRSQGAGEALTQCNALLGPEVKPDATVTSVFALLDPVSGLLQIASAGFCPAFRWRDGELDALSEGGDLLGQSVDARYDQDDFMLSPGESIILCSPGILGVRPEQGDPFGPERVRAVLSAAQPQTAEDVVEALRLDLAEFADAGSLHKLAITMIALTRTPEPARTGSPTHSRRNDLAALGETDTDL